MSDQDKKQGFKMLGCVSRENFDEMMRDTMQDIINIERFLVVAGLAAVLIFTGSFF